MRRSLIALLALLALACGGSPKSATEPTSTTPLAAPSPDCSTTCGRAGECGLTPATGCDAECRAVATDEGKSAYWACLGSSTTCDEMHECARASDAP